MMRKIAIAERGAILVHDCTYRHFARATLAAKFYPENAHDLQLLEMAGPCRLRVAALVGSQPACPDGPGRAQ
jgi:hypothetical protein